MPFKQTNRVLQILFTMAKKQYFQESELVFVEKPKRKFQDLTGQKFGKLTVIGFAGVKNKNYQWVCCCDCGKTKNILAAHLKSGGTVSCGCFMIERIKEAKTKHGQAKKGEVSPTYSCWLCMLARCNNPKNKSFLNYGGRGITVCERWYSFENFLADMGDRPDKGYSLERKENDKGYYKDNCKWATPKEQSNNQRSNHLLTFMSKTQNVTQWAEEIGMNPNTLSARVHRGWPIELALTLPIGQTLTKY